MNRPAAKAMGVAAAFAALVPVLSGAMASPAPIAPAAQPISAADLEFFEARIRPVLTDRCYKCHSRLADKIKGGFMLDTREGMLHGGDTGPAIVPGKPDDSLIIDAISYKDADLQMPPKGDKLSDQQVADITEWIRRGAPDPRSLVAKGSSPAYGGVGREHWSFLPVKKQTVPAVADAVWCKTPVDNFILADLEANQMKPNPPADKYTLIRRATFDLTGLPPTEIEVQRFLADTSPDAWEKVVDRLLASPRYGERWGRYWLDVARYADTKGDTPQRDDPRYPFAWTYRDYVIDAFNSDKPYNQFIIEQLAADRIVTDAIKRNGGNASGVDQTPLAAMGFLTLGNRFEDSVNDIINDRIDVTTKAFLGLTVSCARCHDHKFDPIPTADYYSLYDVFANSAEPKEDVWIRPVPKTPELVNYLTQMRAAQMQKASADEALLELRRTKMEQAERAEKRKELQKQVFFANKAIVDLECTPAAPPKADVLIDVANPRDYPVLLRGEAQNKGPMVTRHFLSILSPDPKHPIPFRNGSGRLDLALAIASPTNPMTARVLVNRLWQQHFGTGFVATPDDLGNQSAPPANPELLDYLAGRFVEEGWSIKKIQRLIMLSSVYQESSAPSEAYAETDPDDRLQWRYNVHQLDFEEMHDSILAIAGTIDFSMGGRPVPIGSEGFASRRAVYAFIDRHNPAEILTQFNFPNPSVPTGKRFLTQVPQQQLFLMNSPLVIETARKLTHSPDFIAQTTDELRVATLYLDLFQRPPTPSETALCLRYVESNPGGTSLDAPAATAQSERASQQAERQAQVAEMSTQNLRRKVPLQVEPGAAAFRSRAPLDAWTKLAHALFQTNEAMFLN
jgi:mono/diheme cytochrome c family protein